MKNLFGFNPQYFDKYAGMSSHEKQRKWVSKANVDMVLNRFTPFTKSKNLKAPTQTIVSVGGTNIEGVDAPIAFHKHGKENKIYVNNAKVDERLSKFDIEDQEDEFKRMMKAAYVGRADIEAINNRTHPDDGGTVMNDLNHGVDDHGMTTPKMQMMCDIHRQILVMGQSIMHGCHSYDGTSELSELAAKDGVMSLAYSLSSGKKTGYKWSDDMYDKIHSIGKVRGDYNKWADKVLGKIKADFGTVNQQDMDESEFAAVLNTDAPLTNKYYYSVKPEKNDSEDGRSACSVGNGKMEYNEEPQFVEPDKKNDVKFEDANDTLTMDDMTTNTKDYFFRNPAKTADSDDWKNRDARMERLSEALYESLVGKIGKRNSQNPAKRLNTRALASDMSDNIYRSKVPLGGKHLNINLILDTSGSMSGYHITDAVDVINCINKLALRGVIEGNLMLTASGASAMVKLPINDDLLPLISAHNGGEGYKHTIGLRWKELKAADYNVALTDGMLTDGHIDQTEMKREGIEIVGLYSVRTENKAELTRFVGSLDRWFTKSAVKENAEEMIYWLIDNAILSYDQNPIRSA